MLATILVIFLILWLLGIFPAGAIRGDVGGVVAVILVVLLILVLLGRV